MTWKKIGDFRTTFSSGASLNRECKYLNSAVDSTIKEIKLLGYSDKTKRIVVTFASKEKANNFLALFQSLNTPVKHFEKLSFPKKIELSSTTNPQYIIVFIKQLISTEPKVKEILNDLCIDFKISSSLGLTLEELKSKNPVEAIKLANEALSNGHNELIWELLQLYYEDCCPKTNPNEPGKYLPQQYSIALEQIYELADSIPSSHPCYTQAQDICVDILMRIDPDAGEEYELLQRKFAHALQGTRQDLTDSLFNQLCGNKFNVSKQANIKGETETLLGLAKTIMGLNAQLEANKKPSFFNENNQRYSETRAQAISQLNP